MFTAAALVFTLTDRFAEIARTSGGRLGVCAQIIETGAAAQLNGSERFPMQSVYKLPIAMAVLDQVDRRKLTLTQKVPLRASDVADVRFHSPLRDRSPAGGVDLTIRELIHAAIVDSDGVASDLLYRIVGGSTPITAYLRQRGISDMAIVATEREMAGDDRVQYRNYATPRAAAALLEALFRGRNLSAEGRQLLLRDLADSAPGANRLKAGLPPGTPIAHKTGTDATRNGMTRATNDIGPINLPDGRHLAIAVFIRDSTADESAREHAIAGVARAAYEALVTK